MEAGLYTVLPSKERIQWSKIVQYILQNCKEVKLAHSFDILVMGGHEIRVRYLTRNKRD